MSAGLEGDEVVGGARFIRYVGLEPDVSTESPRGVVYGP